MFTFLQIHTRKVKEIHIFILWGYKYKATYNSNEFILSSVKSSFISKWLRFKNVFTNSSNTVDTIITQ